MKFHEKLRRRVEQLGLNKSKAAREAGLPESTISNYLVKEESLPRIDIAAKIAKAIRVPLEWLADDAADWPPPDKSPNSLESVNQDILMRQICVRHRRILLELLNILVVAEKCDWSKVNDFGGWKPGESLPDGLGFLLGTIALLEDAVDRIRWLDPWFASQVRHRELEGGTRPESEFRRREVESRLTLLTELPDFKQAIKLFVHHRVRSWNLGEEGIIAHNDGSTVPFASVPGANPVPMLHVMDSPPPPPPTSKPPASQTAPNSSAPPPAKPQPNRKATPQNPTPKHLKSQK